MEHDASASLVGKVLWHAAADFCRQWWERCANAGISSDGGERFPLTFELLPSMTPNNYRKIPSIVPIVLGESAWGFLVTTTSTPTMFLSSVTIQQARRSCRDGEILIKVVYIIFSWLARSTSGDWLEIPIEPASRTQLCEISMSA